MKLIEDMGVSKNPFVIDLIRNRTDKFDGFYHAHQGMELLYVHEGTGWVTVNQQKLVILPGTLICFQPFQLHRIILDVSPASPYVRSIITFEPSVLDTYLQPFPALQQFLRYLWKGALSSQVLYRREQDPYLLGFLEHYRDRFAASPQDEHYEASLLFTVQLLSYMRTYWNTEEDIKKAQGSASQHVQNILQWIEEHYDEDFKLVDLSNGLHLSKYHVSHLFKQFTGSTIEEYLIARRIRQACWLLKTTSLPIKEIGLRIGYSNIPYFCQLFRKSTGMTPLQYRMK